MRGYYERSEEIAAREESASAARHQEERHNVGPETGACMLHVYRSRNEWAVWLNTPVADHDGLCIGIGPDRQAAVEDAAKVLEDALDVMNGPPPMRSRGPALERVAPLKGPTRARCRGMVDGLDVSLPACCERAGQYNGFSSGPTAFTCPKGCPCHD